MRNDQRVRGVAILGLTFAYLMRLVTIGNGPVAVPFVGPVAPFVILAAVVVTLALPETLEYLPIGPTRKPNS